MQGQGTIRLFRRGPTAEFRLFVFVVLSLSLLLVDSRWRRPDPARQAVSVALYPVQRLVLAPRDAIESVNGWFDAASLARTEKEALQRQRIELAQISTQLISKGDARRGEAVVICSAVPPDRPTIGASMMQLLRL